MGSFRIQVDAVGGHGDGRDVGDGGDLDPSTYPEHSVDAIAFDLVDQLRAKGASINAATLIHWPGTESEVVDDLLSRKRAGSF